MIKLQIEKILLEKGISKSEFANMMGIKKQNVNSLLNTNNINKLEEIAQVLNVDITELWEPSDKVNDNINGFIEYNGTVYSIKSKEDLDYFLNSVNIK